MWVTYLAGTAVFAAGSRPCSAIHCSTLGPSRPSGSITRRICFLQSNVRYTLLSQLSAPGSVVQQWPQGAAKHLQLSETPSQCGVPNGTNENCTPGLVAANTS